MVALAGAACAHSNEAQVTVMRSGPIYPSLPDNCSVSFLNHPHLDILASGYEVLATVIFSGTYSEMDRAASAIPGAVRVGACKLGGDSVSLANTLVTGQSETLQFIVWRAPAGSVPATKAPGGSDSVHQQI